MPKGKKLSEFEKSQISALYDQNFTLRHIADQLSRSDKVVRNYLSDPDAYGTNKSSGRSSIVSPREKCRSFRSLEFHNFIGSNCRKCFL